MGGAAQGHSDAPLSAGGTILGGSVVDRSRIRTSLSDDTGKRLREWCRHRWEALRGGGTEKADRSAAAKTRWANWRETRAERDVLGSYRADYGEQSRLRWWQRLRAGVGLFFVIVLLGAGLTMLIGLFFVGVTIALETLV